MAFAGFSAGRGRGAAPRDEPQALGRRRSRPTTSASSRARMATHPDVDEALAERVWTMIVGFSGFGFPKAHGAAFGLLAYQSTWLRVHYGRSSSCARCSTSSRWASIPPTRSSTRRSAAGSRCSPAGRQRAAQRRAAPSTPERTRVRDRASGYVLGVRADEVAALVAAREEGGPFRSLEDLASRAGAGRPRSSSSPGRAPATRSATATGARRCGSSASPRPGAGSASEGDAARRCRSTLPGAAAAAGRSREWDAMIADYATTGPDDRRAPDRPAARRSAERGAVTSGDLAALRHGSAVRIGGLVVARQRPGTAKGVVFMLLEDEHGTINLVVPPEVYERHRLAVRTEPLVVAEGRLERLAAAGGAINVLVRRIARARRARTARWRRSRSSPGTSRCQDFSPRDAEELAPRPSPRGRPAARTGGRARASGRSRRPSSRSPAAARSLRHRTRAVEVWLTVRAACSRSGSSRSSSRHRPGRRSSSPFRGGPQAAGIAGGRRARRSRAPSGAC